MIYISDCHTHTHCSPDASDSVSMMCQAAKSADLYAITITDHCECNLYWQDGYDQTIRQSYLETRQAAIAYTGKLRVLAGIELGQPMQDLAVAEDALSMGELDFVLGSLHNIRGRPDFYELDYRTESVEDLFNAYLDELMEMVEWGKFDSLAHLTYPLRYIVGEAGIPLDFVRFDRKMEAILRRLAEKGIALEVNTSGLRQKIGSTLPGMDIIRRFRECGGKYVTLGSDSHRWKDVGAGLQEGIRLLREAGFTHYTLFEKRRPKLIPLD